MSDNQKHIYQAMFLLDNQEVRKGFNAQRQWLQDLLEKHGITVRVLRLWGERKLAYPIRRRRRATYVLGWLEATGDAVNEVKRELYLVGPVFRCLFVREEEIPEEELAFGIEEVDESALQIPDDQEEEPEEEAAEPAAAAEEQEPAKKAEPVAAEAAPAGGSETPEESKED